MELDDEEEEPILGVVEEELASGLREDIPIGIVDPEELEDIWLGIGER